MTTAGRTASSTTVLLTPLQLEGCVPPLLNSTILLLKHEECLLQRLNGYRMCDAVWVVHPKNTETEVEVNGIHVCSLKPEELENGATTTAPHVAARYVLVPRLFSLPD